MAREHGELLPNTDKFFFRQVAARANARILYKTRASETSKIDITKREWRAHFHFVPASVCSRRSKILISGGLWWRYANKISRTSRSKLITCKRRLTCVTMRRKTVILWYNLRYDSVKEFSYYFKTQKKEREITDAQVSAKRDRVRNLPGNGNASVRHAPRRISERRCVVLQISSLFPSSFPRRAIGFLSFPFLYFFLSARFQRFSGITGFRVTRSRGVGEWHKFLLVVHRGASLLYTRSRRRIVSLNSPPELEKMLLRGCTSVSFSHRRRIRALLPLLGSLDGALFPSSLRPGLRLAGVISQKNNVQPVKWRCQTRDASVPRSLRSLWFRIRKR